MSARKKQGAAAFDYIAQDLWPLARPIGELITDPRNARKHGDLNYIAVKASLEQFGLRQPIVVNKNTMVVEAGNLRLQVARDLGWTHIAVVTVDDGYKEAAAFGIADNRTAELAEWNYDVLGELLAELSTEEGDDSAFDLTTFGWREHELQALVERDWGEADVPWTPKDDQGQVRVQVRVLDPANKDLVIAELQALGASSGLFEVL